MDTLATAMNVLAAQVATNYNAFMGIQHIDAVLFMLAGGALVGVVPYVTKKYSGTIDAPPPVLPPSDDDTVEDDQQALDEIISNTEVSVFLPSAPNVPVPSIWGHPNTIHYTPSEAWNQALTLRTRVPPAQATPLVSLGLLVFGVSIILALPWFVRWCCRGRRSNVAAPLTQKPFNTFSDRTSANTAISTESADARNNSSINASVPTTRSAEDNITSSSVIEVVSLHQRLQELGNVNGTLTTQIRDSQKQKDTAVAQAQDALCDKETVEAQNEYLAQQLDCSENELASLRAQLAEMNKLVSDSQSTTSALSDADQLSKQSIGLGNKGTQSVVPHSHPPSTTSDTPSIDSLYTNEHGNYLPTQPTRAVTGQSGKPALEQKHVKELQQRLDHLDQANAKEVDRMAKEASNLRRKLHDTEQRLGDCEASRTALQQQLQLQGDLQGYDTAERTQQLQQQVEELERELEIKMQSIDEYSQKVGIQQDKHNVLCAQIERYRSHIETENSALIEAKEREDQLEDNLRMAENEIDVLKDRIKELELSGGTQQQLMNAEGQLKTVRAKLKDEQGKLDECKTKRKQQVRDAQYTKALEQQLADLRLQLEALSTRTSESAPDKALKFELADAHYELEQNDRTISDLKKQLDKWQNQAQATEGQAAYDDLRTRSQLMDQVEDQAHTIEKLREQVNESEGRFLVAEGEASIDDLRARALGDSRTIWTQKAELKRLKARLQHANSEPVISTTVAPTILTPAPLQSPSSTVQTSSSSVNARPNPQQEQHTALTRPTAIGLDKLPSDTPKNGGPAVIDASLTRTWTPATTKTPSLLGGSGFASWKCLCCRCSFSGGKVNQTTHEDLCRKWHEDHVYKHDMTLDIEHPPNWENAGPLDPDATKAEWMSLVTDKQKQQPPDDLQVTRTGATLNPITTRGLQIPLKADALDFTPESASTPDAKLSSERPNSTKFVEEAGVEITSKNQVDEFEASQVTGATSGEEQAADVEELNDTPVEDDTVDDGIEGEEDSISESTESSLDFYLGDQSAEADAAEKTFRPASGGEDDVVGYINNGKIPVYANEVSKYLDNPDHDFKWARGKGLEQTEPTAEETKREAGGHAETEGRHASVTSPLGASPTGTTETDIGTPSQDSSSSDRAKATETAEGRIASTSDRRAVTPAPSNHDLNTFKLPLRSSPEDPLPGRQGMRGNRPTGPKLDLTKPSVQRNISSVLNTPGMVRKNSKVSPSLSGSRFAPGSSHHPAITPGPRTFSSINSSILSHRSSLPNTRMPCNTSGQRQLSVGTPNAPTNAPAGPTGKNTCRLCGATFTDTEHPKWSFRQNHLPKCRAWKTEWEPQSYAKQNGDPNFPPQWKNERTQRPAVDPDWLVMAKRVQDERNDKMKRDFFADGTPEAATKVTTNQWSGTEAGKHGDCAVKESITEVEGESVHQAASVKTMTDTALNGHSHDEATKSQSEQQPEPSPGDTQKISSTNLVSPWLWEHDEDESDPVYRVPSWAPGPQSAVRTNDKKQEQGSRSVPSEESKQEKGDMKQAGPSSGHDAALPPTSPPASGLTPSRIPAPASANMAAAATLTQGRNQVLVDVPLSTPTFMPNSGRLSGAGLGGSRWATATPTEGSPTPSPDPRSQNLQKQTSGRGGRQMSNKRKGRGGYGGGKKQ